MAMQRRQEDDGMITKVVSINRVSKTVKGGRVMKFAHSKCCYKKDNRI